jgi:formiminotetrahydrofolate cyclodeaminase
LGLESSEQLRAFCLELSSDKPSPGGGTASAAAGAMAASLLMMVCGITSRSKKHEASKPELERLLKVLETERDGLLRLAVEDARAYDLVVEAFRKRKASQSGQAEQGVQSALKHASDVPRDTASACLRVLESAVKVAELGTRSASSDVGVAVVLAEAGFSGAAKNVRINTKDILDKGYVDHVEGRLGLEEARSKKLARAAISILDRP